ncbi:hypothetical protein DC915_RS02980 [Vibrio parahaemolyticus]|nr:hypothetical protein [Vibrio parahaemolyticus]EJG0009943.1 hypothetical protein [Vibrio parahaemolyticus]
MKTVKLQTYTEELTGTETQREIELLLLRKKSFSDRGVLMSAVLYQNSKPHQLVTYMTVSEYCNNENLPKGFGIIEVPESTYNALYLARFTDNSVNTGSVEFTDTK